jgi:hypothetical protein
MMNEELFKTLFSGEYSRRRYHLGRIINSWDRLIITSVIAIWAFLFDFKNLDAPELLIRQLAWASGLSSIFIGFWRLYVHHTDNSIVKLYPILYLYEHLFLDEKLCTIKTPKNISISSNTYKDSNIDFIKIKYKDFGFRGHLTQDIIALSIIIFFSLLTICLGHKMEVLSIFVCTDLHTVGYLMFLNLIGAILIIIAFCYWNFKKLDFPIPSEKPKDDKIS